MKKKDFSKLAPKGITAGLLLSAPAIQAAQSAGYASCAASSQSQGYGAQGGHGCGAGQSQQNQGYYQGQQNQNYNQGQQAQQNQRPYGAPRPSQSCSAQQNYSSSCGGKGKCSGVVAIGDEPTKPSNQKDYYDSSYENQNKNDSTIVPDRSRAAPQGKYLADGQVVTTQKPITEAELISKLDASGKATYNALAPEGKALALTIANEDNGRKYADKNVAVKMAAEKIASKKKWGN